MTKTEPEVASQPPPVKNTNQPESVDALALSITKDGDWEMFDGERIYQKEVIKDEEIPGHTILKVRTFIPGTNTIKQSNGKWETINLFDSAESCIAYYNKIKKDMPHNEEIAEFRAKYSEDFKSYMPILVDIYGDTYEDPLWIGVFQMCGPKSKRPK